METVDTSKRFRRSKVFYVEGELDKVLSYVVEGGTNNSSVNSSGFYLTEILFCPPSYPIGYNYIKDVLTSMI